MAIGYGKGWCLVSESEFANFLRSYPRPLSKSLSRFDREHRPQPRQATQGPSSARAGLYFAQATITLGRRA
jgi:hypothetical protein